MTEHIRDGGGVFPRQLKDDLWTTGISLREYYAIHMDIGKVSLIDEKAAEAFVGRPIPDDFIGQILWQLDFNARLRFMYADAMLKASEAR